MKSLVIPIRFNKPVNKISDRTEQFLRNLSGLVFNPTTTPEFVCAEVYPITNPRDFPPGPLSDHILNLAASFDQLSTLVIDVGGPNQREVLQPRFVIALVAMIANVKQRFQHVDILLTLPSALDESDDFTPMLKGAFVQYAVSRFYYSDLAVYGDPAEMKRITARLQDLKNLARYGYDSPGDANIKKDGLPHRQFRNS